MKKKVLYITIHFGANFGSVLQSIATYETLNKLGYDSALINYIPRRFSWSKYFNAKGFLRKIYRIIHAPVEFTNRYIYMSFLRKYVRMTDLINPDKNFYEVCPPADIYMSGSDQVWNSKHNLGIDLHYYFDGFPVNSKIISYASSIGQETVSNEEYCEIRRLLSTYSAISVREKSAANIIESMGYKVTHLLDPTFMLTSEEWGKFMPKRIISKPYILIYAPYDVRNTEIIYKSANNIAKSKRLKIVTFSWGIKSEVKADKTIHFADPGDFLSLMYYADYVITTSFHGTAFSINLNKQFFVYYPTGFSTRIESILELCALRDRVLQDNEELTLERISQLIDYTKINSILNLEREKTMRYLTKELS